MTQPRTRRLVEVVGSVEDPVRNIRISGLVFKHTYATHMDAHEVPSAGDWSVTRNAAVFLQGVDNVLVDGN